MEILFLLALALLVLPLILSIFALVRVNAVRQELVSLRIQMDRQSARLTPKDKTPVSSTDYVKPPPAFEPVLMETREKPVFVPPSPMAHPEAPVDVAPRDGQSVKHPKPMLAEVALGGRIASFAGIALLLIGVAFLIGYAIKHAWLGPEARIVLGMVCGAVLIALGHVAEIKGGGRLHVLARTLTGGGSAIFYLCVFAAYEMYHLIPASVTGVGLVICAATALGLAMVYHSQIVAMIGVLGAFLMPPLIGRDDPNLLFLLTYIAVINAPVLVLGIYRNWQWLYNSAFGFTALYVIGQLADGGRPDSWLLLGFTAVYFFQFAALGLYKLRAERTDVVRTADIIRLLLNSLGLLGALYVLLHRLELNDWVGASLLVAAVVHIGLVRLGWRWFPSFTNDMLALLFGALTMASLALPVQLDGAWVSVGWSLEGLLLCGLALRARIPLLQGAAVLLGLIGLFKSVLFDQQFYDTTPMLFINARFMSGLLSTALFGAQGYLHGRVAPTASEETSDLWKLIPPLATLAVPLVFGVEFFWTLGKSDIWAWIGCGLVLLVVATASAWLLRPLQLMNGLSRFLMGLSVVSIGVSGLMWADFAGSAPLFFSLPFLVMLAMVFFALLVWPVWLRRWNLSMVPVGSRDFSTYLNLGVSFAGILLVTLELYRMNNPWDDVLVTIWWALCAITLVVVGMIGRNRMRRYAGLALFTLTTAKVLLVDLGELSGLERIVTFMGAGVLLLILSFVYQRAAERLSCEEEA
jgi:uncharacterized membrane protein